MEEPPSVVEAAVRQRYSEAAKRAEASLCCPTKYDPKLLEVIPREVIERDYGCGDPSRFLQPGETVLDLGSGAGKVCFIASQVVGPAGRVIGVDMNDEMLALARWAATQVAQRIGYSNVTFKKGRIQDLALDLEELDQYLQKHPVSSVEGLSCLQEAMARLRAEKPLVPSESIDVVVSNCVLNLVDPKQKRQLFSEIARVLRAGGRAVISDIVSDEDVPEDLQRDPDLWSGCIAGAFREDLFLQAFEDAGFHGIELVERQRDPWRTVAGIEFRSVTVVAYKGESGPCLDQKHAVIYRGPFRQVVDDDGHVLRRGVPTAVCEKTFRVYSQAPYRSHVELVPPRVLVPLESAPPFRCGTGASRRDPRETKSGGAAAVSEGRVSACATTGNGNGGCC
ncbi:MAG: methyltransferase [Candidatus Binatia bacterium]|nr:MAG: methyltransferase [Candidatus Binatia bacterium]